MKQRNVQYNHLVRLSSIHLAWLPFFPHLSRLFFLLSTLSFSSPFFSLFFSSLFASFISFTPFISLSLSFSLSALLPSRLQPSLKDFAFEGTQSIEIEIVKPTSHIVLHVADVSIYQASLKSLSGWLIAKLWLECTGQNGYKDCLQFPSGNLWFILSFSQMRSTSPPCSSKVAW